MIATKVASTRELAASHRPLLLANIPSASYFDDFWLPLQPNDKLECRELVAG
jgi:hypothetical protein